MIDREIIPVAGAEYRITLAPDSCGWRAECPDLSIGAWGEDRITARANLTKIILDIQTGKETMAALCRAVGVKWTPAKVRGAHKVRRD